LGIYYLCSFRYNSWIDIFEFMLSKALELFNMKWYDIRVEEMNELDSTWAFRMGSLEYLLSNRLNKFIDKKWGYNATL
jgi:hypothetical protein